MTYTTYRTYIPNLHTGVRATDVHPGLRQRRTVRGTTSSGPPRWRLVSRLFRWAAASCRPNASSPGSRRRHQRSCSTASSYCWLSKNHAARSRRVGASSGARRTACRAHASARDASPESWWICAASRPVIRRDLARFRQRELLQSASQRRLDQASVIEPLGPAIMAAKKLQPIHVRLEVRQEEGCGRLASQQLDEARLRFASLMERVFPELQRLRHVAHQRSLAASRQQDFAAVGSGPQGLIDVGPFRRRRGPLQKRQLSQIDVPFALDGAQVAAPGGRTTSRCPSACGSRRWPRTTRGLGPGATETATPTPHLGFERET